VNDAARHIGIAQALDAGAETKYAQEVAPLSSLSTEAAQAEAIKIIRQLAHTSWHVFYGTREMNERFKSLWRMAFPEEEKGGKK
jgi:hypothetical protein